MESPQCYLWEILMTAAEGHEGEVVGGGGGGGTGSREGGWWGCAGPGIGWRRLAGVDVLKTTGDTYGLKRYGKKASAC